MGKSYFALIFVFLVAIISAVSALSATAAISMDGLNKKQLNIGDKLTASYNLSSAADMEAIFRLSLKCSQFELDYYTIPVSLKMGLNKSVAAPPLTINSQMIGSCLLKSSLQSTDKVSSEEMQSDQFEVVNSIGVKLETNGQNFFPGEKLELRGILEESFITLKTVTVSLERQTARLGVAEQVFNHTIELPKTIKSGTHKLTASVNDSYGNSGDASLIITVAQVPTSISASIDRERVNPGEEIKSYAVLLDQANDSMNGKLSVRLALGKDEVMSREVSSGEVFTYRFDAHAPPGTYALKASGLGLKAEKKIIINTVEAISTSFDGKRIVKVTNTGNVNYEKYVDIRLSPDDGAEMSLVRKLNLKPGEETSFDLYKEVPSGTYTLNFVSNNEPKSYSNITTKDERSFVKKLGDLAGGTTGLVVGTNANESILFKRPFLITITVLAVIVLLVLIYRSEKRRRSELSQKKISDMEEEKARQVLGKAGRDDGPKQDIVLSRDNPENRKFVEEMLKGKQFK